MARKLAAVAFSLGCFHAGSLMALGLGEMKLESFLNEPLKASVDLLNMSGLQGDEVKIRLATSEDFDKLGLERAYFLTSITFHVVVDDQGGAHIEIRSEDPVLEPYLDFVVEARWPSGRLLREYTVLVDPPVFSHATPVASASERVQEVEGIAAPAKKNEQITASGTRVDLRESDLAPGAMPHRNYNATTDSTPSPGSRYMIGRDQTLWEIANQAKPAGASVHQTMLEIQRLNPDAFINGNINRIKAGYIIYLPSAEEINSVDLSTALTEVREQNAAWRDGRDQERYANNGPSLRISAEPEEQAAPVVGNRGLSAPGTSAVADQPATAGAGAGTKAGATDAATTPGSSGETQERLAALEQQLETLQRIVSLKDNQIAALQNALANTDGKVAETTEEQVSETVTEEQQVTTETLEQTVVTTPTDANEVPGAQSEISTATTDTVTAETAPATEPKVATVSKPKPAKSKTATTPASDSGEGWVSYLLYGLGALVLAIAGLVFARRRTSTQEQVAPTHKATPRDDVFSDVHLQEPNIELIPAAEELVEAPGALKRNNRGYGEHKHDEYASDVDAADALAEADIYIAYGRHPQAVDLLNNALANEPGNPVYRLKLLEIYTELNNRVAATAQLNKIRELGDPESTSRAESLMEGLRAEDEAEPSTAKHAKPAAAGGGPGLSPNPFAVAYDSGETLEDDFSGLEIEGQDDDDLDLSGDFVSGHTDSFDDEELVIAADSNGLSTKLDLARAYLDMGDDEGARQILEEVVADGTEELKTEARALLARIGR